MKNSKQWFIRLVMLMSIIGISINSYAASTPSFNNIIFFGDSLSDNGNLYHFDKGLMPKSPPYYGGRFSNGPTWAEDIAQYYQTKYAVTSANYAVGGETAVIHNPISGSLPFTLYASFKDYLWNVGFWTKQPKTLYVIWIGANDYSIGNSNVNSITNQVISNIDYVINDLIVSHDAKYFLLVNLPDLSKTPRGAASGMTQNLQALTNVHNAKLAIEVSKLQAAHRDVQVHLFDVHDKFNELLSNSAALSKKYNLGLDITDATTPCWPGGYTSAAVEEQQNRVAAIAAQLEADLNNQPANLASAQDIKAPINVQSLAQFIVNSPDLSVAYDVGQNYAQKAVPCSNPKNYIFWDQMHPTAAVHAGIAKMAIDYIQASYH